MDRTFGELIRFYRTTRGSHGRANQEWLGLQLGAVSPKSAVDLISQTERGHRMLSRRDIIRFGALYALTPTELDDLISAARTQTRQRRKAQSYTSLTPTEIEPAVFGPWDLPRWRDRVEIVVATNLRGNVDSSAPIAQAVLNEIESAFADADELEIQWHDNEVAEAHTLWLTAWIEFAFAIEATVRSENILKVVHPYLRFAHRIRDQLDQSQTALLDYAKADLMHCLAALKPDMSMKAARLAQTAMPYLPNTWHRMGCQRIILLDGSTFLPDAQMQAHVGATLSTIDSYTDSDYRGLIHGTEGLGQLLTRRVDLASHVGRTGMDTLRQTAALSDDHHYQFGHIMVLRSQMKALAHAPSGFDRDQFAELGTQAITITRQRGWDRKTQQVQALGEQNGVAF